MYFASVNQLMSLASSRRDDLHSLVYLMIFLLNKGRIPCLDDVFALDIGDVNILIQKTLEAKKKVSIKKMCTGRAMALERFCREINSLSYKDEPNYAKLR